MKNIALFIAFFLVISCSDSDKASGEKNQQIWIDGIDYEVYDSKLYLIGNLQSKTKSCISNNFGICDVNNCWLINGEYGYYSLKKLDACHLKDYLWIIDNDTIPSFKNPYNAVYGEHLVSLVLVDAFGDSINYSEYIKINEPLKVELLSPIHNFDFLEADSIKFEYKIRGVDSWEQVQSSVYVSATRDLLWEEEKKLPSDVFKPPWSESNYFWGVIASTEFESDTSRIRCIGC
jgi:hypothetical protein